MFSFGIVYFPAQAQLVTETTVYLHLVSRGNSLPPPDTASQRITVPEGFHLRIFAENLAGRPHFMAIGPDGHLYISLMNPFQPTTPLPVIPMFANDRYTPGDYATVSNILS
jgi:hypothetical protein